MDSHTLLWRLKYYYNFEKFENLKGAPSPLTSTSRGYTSF